MSHKSLIDAITKAKEFTIDTAIVRDTTAGDYEVIRISDVTTIPETFKHIATVRAVVNHEVTYHD